MAISPVLLATVGGVSVETSESGVPYWDSIGDGLDGNEGPDYMTDPHDVAIINGLKVPGITRVKGLPKKKIDVPKAPARDGGPPTDRGHENARLEVTFQVWTTSQWRLLQVILKKIWRPPGAPIVKPAGSVKNAPEIKAITIVHPDCSSPPWSISAILIESLETPEYTPQKGAIIRMKAVQYIAPSKANVTRGAAGAGPPLAKEITGARSAPPARPSTTDAVPVLPPAPARGAH